MNLIVMTNVRYHQDHRKYLVRSAQASGSVGIHVYCWETIEITVGDREIKRFPGTDDVVSAYDYIRDLSGNDKSIVLTGLGGHVNNFALRARQFLPDSLFVYDVYDDLTFGATGWPLAKLIYWDMRWRLFCNIVMIKEEGMKRRYPRSLLLKNASHLRPLPKTHDYNPPRLVYAGSIDSRVDLHWLDRLAAQDVTLDIYGWFHIDTPEMRALLGSFVDRHENVAYKGMYDDDDLAQILGNYSAGIIPYKKYHRMTKHVTPNKAYHYLNAGLEVIASPIPHIMLLKEYVHVAETSDDFSCIVDRASRSPKALAWPVECNTWEKRWQELLEIASAWKHS